MFALFALRYTFYIHKGIRFSIFFSLSTFEQGKMRVNTATCIMIETSNNNKSITIDNFFVALNYAHTCRTAALSMKYEFCSPFHFFGKNQ